jgi:hypothetical protein
MKQLIFAFVSGLALLASSERILAQPKPIFFQTNKLPPPNGAYISPAQWHALYANGVIISNVTHRAFTESLPPPPLGASSTHTFNSDLDFDLSLNNGATFTRVSAPAVVTVNVQAVSTSGGQQIYDTEMLQLNLAGGSLPSGVQLRESPTLPSKGQTTIAPTPGGFLISSFFDVFTEVSLDGGRTWSASTQAGHVELRADPVLIPPVPQPTALMPPPEALYVTPGQAPSSYPGGVVIKSVRHKFSSQSLNLATLPPGTNVVTEQFSSAVTFQLSLDGGQTFSIVTAPAAVTVLLKLAMPGSPAASAPALYDTEMTQLGFTISGLPTPIMIRESPTLSSYGETALGQLSDGSYFVSSFFDIFTEVSLDGGQTWQAETSGPTHVELQRAAMVNRSTVPNLPPTNGQFNLPALVAYPNGIQVSNVIVQNMSPSLPLPPPGQSQTQEFAANVALSISLDGGKTFRPAAAPASGLVTVSNAAPVGSLGPAQYLNTELLQLNISGGTLPPGIMIRESPTKASLGRTTVVQDTAGAGGYRISSFFDVFTELSTDSGQSWNAAVIDPNIIAIVPNPPFAPYVITCPSNITVYASSSAGAVVNYSLPPIVIFPDCPFCCFAATCVPPSGSVFPIGTTTVNCTGSDGCGEHPTCSFTVTVLKPFIYGGLFDTVLGNAILGTLTTGNGSIMVVSNLGPSGSDGFHVDLGAVDSVLLNFQPFPTTYNTCVVAQVTGPYAAAANAVLGIGTYFGGTNPMIRADFSSLNATSVVLEVRDENNHFLSATRYPNAAWINVNPLFPPCTNTTTVYTYGQSADHICYRFCKFGCNCLGTNCWIERIACFRPDLASLPLNIPLAGLDVHSQGPTVPSTLPIQDQEIGMFGLLHEALGQATLEAHPGVLLVNDIGSSGQDGLMIMLNNAGKLDLTLAPTRLMSQGHCFKVSASGKFSFQPNINLGTATLTQSVGPGGGCDVSVDFSAIGSTLTRVDVYQGAQFVGTTTLPNSVVGTLHATGNLIACGKLPPPIPCFWMRFDAGFLFSSSDNKQFSGDEIRLLAANPAGQVQALSQFRLQGCNLGSLALLGASVPPTIGSILKRSDGTFEVDGTGLAGVNCRLEGGAALTSPMHWAPVSSMTSDLDGTFRLFDARPTAPMQFYHVVTP